MITVNNTFKITGGRFTDRAEIDMDEHENRDTKTCQNMQQVSYMQSTLGEYRRWD